MPRLFLPACLTLLVLLVPLAAKEPAGTEASWPQWRGPSGQGYSDDARVPLAWSEKDHLLWKTPVPAGNSTPIVWGGRVFLTAASGDGRERSSCASGQRTARSSGSRRPRRGSTRGGRTTGTATPRPRCATDGERVYAFFGTPGLICYDLEGKLLWKHNFGVFTSEAGWGTAASPFLFEDLVIQNCDNDGAAGLPPGRKDEQAAPMDLVALDKKTGEVRWSTPRNQGRGFSTPRLVPVAAGRVDLVLNGPQGVWGYDPRSGKELWRCTRSAPGDQHRFGEPMPVSDNQTLFILSGRPGPCQALRLPGSGDVTPSHVLWQEVRKGHRDVASPIAWEGRVYAADSKGVLSCYDLREGKELYNERLGAGKAVASPIALRGKLLFVLDDGVTAVLEPGPTFKVAGRNRLGEGKALDFLASPAVAAGRLFLRSQSHLYCIGEQ